MVIFAFKQFRKKFRDLRGFTLARQIFSQKVHSSNSADLSVKNHDYVIGIYITYLYDQLSNSSSYENILTPYIRQKKSHRKKVKWVPLPSEYYGFYTGTNSTDCTFIDIDHDSSNESDLEFHLSHFCPNYKDFNFDCVVYSDDQAWKTKLLTFEKRVQCRPLSIYDDLDIILDKYDATNNNYCLVKNSTIGGSLRSKKKWCKLNVHVGIKTGHIHNLQHKDGKRIYVNHRIHKKLLKRNMESVKISETVNVPQKPISSQKDLDHNNEFSTVPHQLIGDYVPDDINDDLITLLIDLQYRDVNPEDYDLLLSLDDRIAPKTVSQDVIDILQTSHISASEKESCPSCIVCMEMYCEGEEIKHLPCKHFFHSKCIEQWLTNCSTNCPLDGSPIQ